MLRKALNISWPKHVENKHLYEHLPPVSTKVSLGECEWPITVYDILKFLRTRSYYWNLPMEVQIVVVIAYPKKEIRTCMMDRDIWRKLCYTDYRDEDWQDRPRNYAS